MELIEWNESYRIGVDRIDRQHALFVGYLNELYGQVADQSDPGVVGVTLNRLSEYATLHFTDEESLMRSAGYPETQRHVALHDEFRLQLVELKSKYRSQDRAVVRALVEFTGSWLSRHILEVDRGLGRYLQEAGKLP